MSKKTALVVGGSGVIGRNLANYLAKQSDWNTIAVAREIESVLPSNVKWVSMDLLDQADVAKKIHELQEVTHVFYAAYIPKPTFAEEVEPNLLMLKNILQAIQPVAKNLTHVVINEGVKAYGVHLGPFKTPAKETDARHMPPNFYYTQEDFLKQEQVGKTWNYTVLRPDVVCGFSVGSAMNLPLIIATYAAISKELGLPLRFPGKWGAYNVLAQAMDATLHAEAMVWAASSPNTKNDVFNVTNGDLFRWSHVWKDLAKFFDMDLEQPQTISLVQWMADKGEVWDNIVKKYGLKPYKLHQLAAFGFGDFIFGCDYDVISDVTKSRQAGFQRAENSHDMFIRLLQEFRDNKIIP
jgi:nucleoside-diphosphate-sugar epimerase